jgi:deoxyribodipyrimidine photo-lyase
VPARSRLLAYKDQRDFPAINGTSTLSPYLAVGAISPRQCLAAAVECNAGRTHDGQPGCDTWISELVWREFYKHILVGFPRVNKHRAFREETEELPWNDDDDQFQAWCDGRTGFPIVDAAMRQLRQTGWMHNRLRMVVAMFLTKDLFIDWRRGEQFFMQHLVDGDLAANNGGWQWSASTGTDAAPYFRIFNPISQSRKFDPHGAFIRRFLPEIAHLDDDAIHEPYGDDAPLLTTKLAYPRPMIDRELSRERVLKAFSELKGKSPA